MKKITNTSTNPQINWLFGGSPQSIEAQEKQGQQELAQSSQLPFEVNGKWNWSYEHVVKEYEKLGIKVLNRTEGDPIFVDVEMPAGWNIKPTGHSMWNHLIDDKGRVRGQIFYKAAFYDRSSSIRFNCRYTTDTNFQGEGDNRSQSIYVIDNSTKAILFETKSLKEDYNDKEFFNNIDKLRTETDTWLEEKFPEHNDFTAYWD